jgi:hypothetical protein
MYTGNCEWRLNRLTAPRRTKVLEEGGPSLVDCKLYGGCMVVVWWLYGGAKGLAPGRARTKAHAEGDGRGVLEAVPVLA